MSDTGELGNQRKEEERNKGVKVAQAQVDDATRWMMSDPRGRAFVWAQLERAALFATTFNRDAGQMSFNEGKRSLGLELLADIMRLTPDQYSRMASEGHARRNPPKEKKSERNDPE